MAKRSGSSSQPLDLLTAAERKLFDTSSGRALAAATRAELTKLVGQARSLRDKWRDQFRTQRRTSQRAAAARGTGGNDRSREKSELFGEMVGRLEARLAELGGAAAAAVQGAGATTRVTKAARTKGHRATRAATRSTLAALTTAKAGQTRVSRTAAVKATAATKARPETTAQATAKPAAKTAAKKPATNGAKAKADAAAQPAAAKRPAVAKASASKKRRTGRPVTVAVEKATGKTKKRVITADAKAQRGAATKLKAARVHLAGLDTRLRGHTMAQGRRQQGRRDSRTR